MSSEQQAAKQAVEAYTTVESVVVKPIAMFSVMLLVYAYTRWIIALFLLTAIFNATILWINMDQSLITFNAVKTNDYIPFLKTLLSGTRPPAWSAR
ncbi:hypothetical protein PM082_024842 [Marasmius tenuissimus]|nr:hypothetical protein PM082_024842 [Marasmius tenuissimus]